MYFCGVPSKFTGFALDSLCRWPAGHVISVSLHQYVPRVDPKVQDLIHRAAWAAWSRASGMRYTFVDPWQFTNIRVTAADLGGRNGVLARAALPCGGVGPTAELWQEYDTSEAWGDNPMPVLGKIDLLAVVVHEAGHSLGLPHGPEGNVMAPNYTGSRNLSEWDHKQIVDRYGKPGVQEPDLTLVKVLQLAREFLDDLLKNG